jgi:tetratricopeptide (TPR) repeat protein
MKKTALISGIAAVVLMALLLTGMAAADDAGAALRQGNRLYEAGEFEAALSAYEQGLEAAPLDKALNFGAGQAAYKLGDYVRAAEYYEKSGDSIDKFLNYGNAAYRLGEGLDDVEQKLGCFLQALEVYKEGIEKYPEDVELKFNFEFVKKKIEELLEAAEQSGEGEEGEGEEGEGEESGQSEGEGAEGQEGDQSAGESGDEQEGESAEASAGEEGDEPQSDEEIERILALLEAQEDESLKNNQEIQQGTEGQYGW